MSSSPADTELETLAAYDENAPGFATRWWNDRLTRQMAGFRSLLDGTKVLDLGCGAGRDSQWLMELGYSPTGVDLSRGMLAEGRRRVRDVPFVRGTMVALPFSSGCFDGAWACSSLVHLPHPDTERAIAEIARVLRPGAGMYIGLEEGHGCEWRAEENGARRLYYFWSPEDLVTVLSNAGLDAREQFVEHVGPWHFLTVLGVRSPS